MATFMGVDFVVGMRYALYAGAWTEDDVRRDFRKRYDSEAHSIVHLPGNILAGPVPERAGGVTFRLDLDGDSLVMTELVD